MFEANKQYWWDGTPNFGDLIGPDIINSIAGCALPLARAGDKNVLLGPGSIIDYCEKFASSIVWGSGIDPHYGKIPLNLSAVKFLAVRGPLTRELLKLDISVLGDPGLLLPSIFPRKPEAGPVAIVVHHSTTKRRLRDMLFNPYNSGYHIVDPRNSWRNIVDQICSSSFVFCQSLHGAIVAEAYGVPWAWWKGFHGRVATFKWHDWFGSIGIAPADFSLRELDRAMRWRAHARTRIPDLVALRQVLMENVAFKPSMS